MKGKVSLKVQKGNIFWGILLILAAIAFIVNKLGFLEGIGIWSIVFSIALVGIFINGIIKRSFWEMLLAIAFLIIVNDELLHLEAITPWPVLGAALLMAAGLNMLFPRFRRKIEWKIEQDGENITVDEERREGTQIYLKTTFGSTVKYITGEVESVNAECTFGSEEIYFSDAILPNAVATARVNVSFGKVVLHVPENWSIVDNTSRAFAGGSEMDGNGATVNTLYVDGRVSFGALVIQRI